MIIAICFLAALSVVPSTTSKPFDGYVAFVDATFTEGLYSVSHSRLAGLQILSAIKPMNSDQSFSIAQHSPHYAGPAPVPAYYVKPTKATRKGKTSVNKWVFQSMRSTSKSIPPKTYLEFAQTLKPNTICVFVCDDPNTLEQIEKFSPKLYKDTHFEFRAIQNDPPSVAILKTRKRGEGFVFTKARKWTPINPPYGVEGWADQAVRARGR